MDERLRAFNLGFRRGANDRARAGLPRQGTHEPPDVPDPAPGSVLDRRAWRQGYPLGFAMGASDDELASVPVPGAVGMIREVGPELLAMLGLDE